MSDRGSEAAASVIPERALHFTAIHVARSRRTWAKRRPFGEIIALKPLKRVANGEPNTDLVVLTQLPFHSGLGTMKMSEELAKQMHPATISSNRPD